MAKNSLTKKRLESLLRGLTSKRALSCAEGTVAEIDFDILEKSGYARKKKDKIKTTDTQTWFLYKCTTKAEKTYDKIKTRK